MSSPSWHAAGHLQLIFSWYPAQCVDFPDVQADDLGETEAGAESDGIDRVITWMGGGCTKDRSGLALRQGWWAERGGRSTDPPTMWC